MCYDFSFEILSCYSWSLVAVFWRIYENTLLLFVKLIEIQGTEWTYTLSRRSRRRRDWWTLTFPFPRSQILALFGANCLQHTHTHTLNMHFLEPVAATPARASYSDSMDIATIFISSSWISLKTQNSHHCNMGGKKRNHVEQQSPC
jgi:hypothetical protein